MFQQDALTFDGLVQLAQLGESPTVEFKKSTLHATDRWETQPIQPQRRPGDT